jgi:hypothetical protein
MEQALLAILVVVLILALFATALDAGYWRERAEKAEDKYRAVMADIVRMD